MSGRKIVNLCSVPDCTKPVRCKMLCNTHYSRLQRLGHPEKTLLPEDADYRLRRVSWTVTDSGCWEWAGARNVSGYGNIRFLKAYIAAHRLAYETWVGPIPEGHLVRHRCDNPPCINPDHLETGTPADNMKDMVERGRSASGENHPGCKLTDQDVCDIRDEYAKGVLTQQMLAEVYGISATHISRILRRERRFNAD